MSHPDIITSSLLAFLFAIGPLPAGVALGVDTTWQHDPATPGDWFDPANWSNGVPVYGPMGSEVTGLIANGGTALISAASAGANGLFLRGPAAGNVVQSGSSYAHIVLQLENGTYALRDTATFETGLLQLFWPEGAFVQEGGTANITKMEIAEGSYTLGGGRLSSAREEIFGGAFTQTGGTHEVTHGPIIDGTYNLEGGTLTWWLGAFLLHRSGHFIQSGGSLDGDYLQAVPYSGHTPTLTLSGGVFHVDDFNTDSTSYGYSTFGLNIEMTSPAAQISAGTFRLLAGTTLSAVPGSRVTVGKLVNKSADPVALAGLSNLNLIVQGGPGWVVPVEAAGKDVGAVAAGWVDNFALAALTLGDTQAGKVRLVNDFDNQPAWALAEALYVDSLVLNPGAAVDLNGLNLYYRNGGAAKKLFLGDTDLNGGVDFADYQRLESHFGATSAAWADGDFNGDQAVSFADYQILEVNFGHQTPEPATLAILALGLAGLLCRRRLTQG